MSLKRDRERALGPVPPTEDRLVQLIVDFGPASRADFARRLGLSRTRVGTVASRLIDLGVLEEQSAVDLSGLDGRAGQDLTLARGLGAVAGVQFAAGHTDVAFVSLGGDVLAERHCSRIPTEDRIEDRLSAATEMVRECIAESGTSHLRAVGVGGFGQIDPVTGVISTHPDEIWWGVNLKQVCAEAFGVAVVAQNNSRLEALAESTWGAGRGSDSMLYLQLSHGLSATMVMNGALLSGAHGGAGELGHLSVDLHGDLCSCGGRGCLGLVASGGAIRVKLRDNFGDDWEAMILAAQAGNRLATRAFLDAADILGRAVVGLANVIDPAVIVVGGDMMRSGPRFLERLTTEFHDHALGTSGRAEVVPATFGGLGPGGALAGALLARRELAQDIRAVVAVPVSTQASSQ